MSQRESGIPGCPIRDLHMAAAGKPANGKGPVLPPGNHLHAYHPRQHLLTLHASCMLPLVPSQPLLTLHAFCMLLTLPHGTSCPLFCHLAHSLVHASLHAFFLLKPNPCRFSPACRRIPRFPSFCWPLPECHLAILPNILCIKSAT